MIRALVTSALLCGLASCGRAPGTTTPATPVADPATTGTIAGAVKDRASGDTLSFATVNATPAGQTALAAEFTETTSARGEFAIRGLPPGRYAVTVYYANVNVRWQEVDVRIGETAQLDIEISLEPTTEFRVENAESDDVTRSESTGGRHGTIAGSVIDEKTGEKLEGAVVAATSPDMRDAQLSVTDETGSYRILGLAPGVYKISVYYRLVDYGYIEVQRNNVQVEGGATTEVPLKLDTNVQAAPN